MALTQQQLEKHLWRAADILRGRIDSGDYKHYIFGLLFFKRHWTNSRIASCAYPGFAIRPRKWEAEVLVRAHSGTRR